MLKKNLLSRTEITEMTFLGMNEMPTSLKARKVVAPSQVPSVSLEV